MSAISPSVAALLERITRAAKLHGVSEAWLGKKLFGSVHAVPAFESGDRSPTQRVLDRAEERLAAFEQKGREAFKLPADHDERMAS